MDSEIDGVKFRDLDTAERVMNKLGYRTSQGDRKTRILKKDRKTVVAIEDDEGPQKEVKTAEIQEWIERNIGPRPYNKAVAKKILMGEELRSTRPLTVRINTEKINLAREALRKFRGYAHPDDVEFLASVL